MPRPAFTLVELMVVITIIVVLLALLAPAMDQAINQAEKAVCKSKLHVIHVATTQYAMLNKQFLFICNGREIQTAFSPKGADNYSSHAGDETIDWLAAMATVGLAESWTSTMASQQGLSGGGAPVVSTDQLHQPTNKIWSCPSTKFDTSLSWDAFWSQWWVGYVYMGGIETWYSSKEGAHPARSPTRLGKSDGGWMLAADRSFRANDAWTDLGSPTYKDNPNHPSGTYKGPEGNNQVYMDGSVDWINGRDLINIHSYRGGFTEMFFFWQADLGGWSPQDVSRAETYFDK